MTDSDQKAYIKSIAQELALASHQAKDRETSGLFQEIRNSIEKVETKLTDLKSSVDSLEASYITIDKKTVNYDLTTRIVYGLVGLLLTGAMGAMMALIFV